MEKVQYIYNVFIGEFRNDTLNQNLTFVVAIAAGLLTISALVTIFISLNKQHIIQKCKELTWDIEDIINGNGRAYNKYELKSKFTLYQRLVSEPLLFNFKPLFINFNNWAILLTVIYLIITIRIWFNIGKFLGNDMTEITVIGIVLLSLFACLMLTLLSVRITGNFDKPNNMLDGNKQSKVKSKDLCSVSSSLILKSEDNILLGNLNLSLPIINVEISPLIYGISYDKKTKCRSIKKMDFLCSPYFPKEEATKFEYTSEFQKKIIAINESKNNDNYISGTIRIGDKTNPSPRNKRGMFSNSFYPIGYNYALYFIDLKDKEERNHTEFEIDISCYDELQIYCYFRTNEGTSYVEYGTIKIENFKERENQTLDLIPISISHDNEDFEGTKWERKVVFKKAPSYN